MTEIDKTKKLKMYVVCCHVDKPMEEGDLKSVYNVPIQAGAALTDKRICELNDHDGFPESISDRNKRYSEMTAMYRIGKLNDSEYVGITHYRRRFLLSDKQLEEYMDKGFDIITTKSYPLPEIVTENYRVSYYGADWDLFMDILTRLHPEDINLANEVYAKNHIHPCNMNIFRTEVYREYCDYVFPVLDEFYKKSPWKKDVYQRRDVGFIGERLSSLFVEKKLREGCRVYEAPFRDLRSKSWSPEDECRLDDYDAVYKACQKYYLADDITKCRQFITESVKKGGIKDDRIRKLLYLFKAGVREQKIYKETFYEYLPDVWKKDLDTLLAAFDGVGNLVKILSAGITPEAKGMYDEFMGATGFSEVVFKTQCEMNGINEALFEKVNGINPVLVILPEDICYGSLRYIAKKMGESLERKGEHVYYANGANTDALLSMVGDDWKFILGVQAKSLNADYFARKKHIPKIQIIMDSTYFVPDLFEQKGDDYYILCHDRNYSEYVKKHHNIKNVYEFIPGYDVNDCAIYEKEYDLSFVGTYKKPIDGNKRWDNPDYAGLYNYILEHPLLNYEEAIKLYYKDVKEMDLSDEETASLLWELRDVLFSACDYFRNQIIKTIVNSGIKLHVFGDTWKNYIDEGAGNLVIHDATNPEDGIKIMKKSKMSLNIMSWHKAGITERVINIMGSGAVLISDESTGILENFNCDDNDTKQEVVVFKLDSLNDLPGKIKRILDDEKMMNMISDNATGKINSEYTWDKMTDNFYG